MRDAGHDYLLQGVPIERLDLCLGGVEYHSSFEQVFGAGFFAHLAAHPELGERFQEMMAHLNLVTAAAICRRA